MELHEATQAPLGVEVYADLTRVLLWPIMNITMYVPLINETRAVCSELKLWDTSRSDIWLELDSLVLVQILRDEIYCPWHIHYFVQAIKVYLNKNTNFISHTFHEGNTVADGLVNEAIDQQQNKVFYNLQSLPMHIRGAMVLDMASLPSIIT